MNKKEIQAWLDYLKEAKSEKERQIFWEVFQGSGMSREVFDVLYNSALKRIREEQGKSGIGLSE